MNSRVRFSVQTETRRRLCKVSARKNPAQCRRKFRNFIQCKLEPLVHLVQILCISNFNCSVDIVSLLSATINSFHSFSLLIEFTGYFQKVASLHNKMRHLYRHVRKRCRRGKFSSPPFISVIFSFTALLQ